MRKTAVFQTNAENLRSLCDIRGENPAVYRDGDHVSLEYVTLASIDKPLFAIGV